MKLITYITLTLLFLATPVLAAGTQADKSESQDQVAFATLIPTVIVTEGVVRLGDIFNGAGTHAERIVAYAPRPGSRAVFDARWLARVAQAFKLNWRPASMTDSVQVERASQIVSKSDVEDLLQQRLSEEGYDANSRAVLSNRAFRLYLPISDQPGDTMLSVEQLTVDPSSNRFSALMSWGTGADDNVRVVGRVERMSQVPVLNTRVQRGEIIGHADLDWLSMPEARLPRNAITDAAFIVGMSAKRTLSVGKPLSNEDVRRPLLVNRGETVTMVLATPSMQLTAKGRALEHGSEGDTIRISNMQTNTVVDAVVIGPGQARVDTIVNLAMR